MVDQGLKGTWRKLGYWALVLAIGTSGLPPAASAQSSGLTSFDPAQFQSGLPKGFDQVNGNNLKNILSMCGEQTKGILKRAGSILQKAATGVPLAQPGEEKDSLGCSTANSIGDADDLACANVQSGGKYDANKWEQLNKQNQSYLSALSCKKDKFSEADQAIQCLSQQASMLVQNIASLQAAFVGNIQRMQKDLAQLNAIKEDRVSQMQEVQKRLHGDKQTGKRGILELRDETKKLVEAMEGEIQTQIKEPWDGVALQKKVLNERIESLKMGLASKCFQERKGSGYRCLRNGPPVTAKEYVLCRYGQNQTISKVGTVESDKGTLNRAASAQAGLEALLSEMFEQMPSNASIPKSEEEATAFMSQSSGILTVQQLRKRFGERLAAFNGKGLDIEGFVMKTMASCYKRANADVERERTRDSVIRTQIVQTQKAEERAQRATATILNRYSEHYSAAFRALTGNHMPVNTAACTGAKPNTQIQCAEDLKTNMTQLLAGTGPNSSVAMTVRAPSNQSLSVAFTCDGLNDCAQKLENLHGSLDEETKRIDTYKQNYVMTANQNIDRFAKQMAGMLNQHSQALMNQLQGLNMSLAALGVSPGLEIRPMDPEQLVPQEPDGLFGPPNNVMALIGAQMNPPLPNINANSFSELAAAMAKARNKATTDLDEANRVTTRLASLKISCSAEDVEDKFESAKAAFESLRNANCGYLTKDCGAGGETGLDSLLSELARVEQLQFSGFKSGNVSRLRSGIDGLCNRTPESAKYSVELAKKNVLQLQAEIASKRCEAELEEGESRNTDCGYLKDELKEALKEQRDVGQNFAALSSSCRSLVESELKPALDELGDAASRAREAQTAH